MVHDDRGKGREYGKLGKPLPLPSYAQQFPRARFTLSLSLSLPLSIPTDQMTTTTTGSSGLPEAPSTPPLHESPLRRNRVGTRGQDLYSWPEQQFSDLDSPFALQEYLQDLIRNDPTNVERHIELPDDQDPEVWQYEHLRAICQELHSLVVQLVPECTVQTCPEMKAGDWIYLCAAHAHPQPVGPFLERLFPLGTMAREERSGSRSLPPPPLPIHTYIHTKCLYHLHSGGISAAPLIIPFTPWMELHHF